MNTSWRDSTLGAELELVYGKSLPEHSRMPGDVLVFGSNGVVGSHGTPLVDAPGIIVGRKGSVGEVTFSEKPFWPIDTTYYVRNKAGHDWRYLYYLLKHCKLTGLNSHSAVPGLNRESAYVLPVSLPDLTEQIAISRRLDSVERAVEIEEQLRDSTRELRSAVMVALFTRGLDGERQRNSEIGPIPETWDVMSMGSVGRIGNGSTPKRTEASYWQGGTHPWLTSGKIHERIITNADEFVTDTAISECHLPIVPAGSLLVAITGQGKTLGNVALATFDTSVSQHLAYCTIERDDVDPQFLRLYLASRYDYLRGLGQAGGSTKSALTCSGLKMVPIPKPPLDEQREIARALLLIERKIEHHERRRALLAELFETLLDDLMTGRRRVADTAADAAAVAA